MSVLTAGSPPGGSLGYQLDTGFGRLTPFERAECGKAAQAAVPRDQPCGIRPAAGSALPRLPR